MYIYLSITYYNILGYYVEHTQFTVLKDLIIWYAILYLTLSTQHVPDSIVGAGIQW